MGLNECQTANDYTMLLVSLIHCLEPGVCDPKTPLEHAEQVNRQQAEKGPLGAL